MKCFHFAASCRCRMKCLVKTFKVFRENSDMKLAEVLWGKSKLSAFQRVALDQAFLDEMIEKAIDSLRELHILPRINQIDPDCVHVHALQYGAISGTMEIGIDRVS